MKRKCYLIIFLAIVSIIHLAIIPALANNIDIIVEDQYLETEVSPIMKQDRTLVPIRPLAEKLNFDVKWDENEKRIDIGNGTKTIILFVGMKDAFVDSERIVLDVAPEIINGRTMVPLRFVGEALEHYVTFDEYMFERPMIWITSSMLLKPMDYLVSNNLNYRAEIDQVMGNTNYILRENGETARHIHLGHSLSEVKEAYGIPMSQNLDNNNTGEIEYCSPYIPHTGYGYSIVFTFSKGILISTVVYTPS